MSFLEKVKKIVYENVPPSLILTKEEYEQFEELRTAHQLNFLQPIDTQYLFIYIYLLEESLIKAQHLCATYSNTIEDLQREIKQRQLMRDLNNFICIRNTEEEYLD